MPLVTDVQSNGFGDIRLREISRDVDLGSYWYRYVRGVDSPCSVLNLGGVFNRLPNYNGTSLNKISSFDTWENVNTQEYLNAIADFKAHTIFIWGDADSGGVFCYKDNENNTMHIGVMYGWYEITDASNNDLYGYCIGRQDYYGISQINSQNVVITFSGEITNGDSELGKKVTIPIFTIMCAGLGSPCSFRDANLTYLVPAIPVVDYPTNQTSNGLQMPVGNVGYIQSANNDGWSAERIWLPTIAFDINYLLQNVIINDVQGSWSGGRNIDPGIEPFEPGGTATPAGGRGEYPTKSDQTRSQNPNESGVDAIGCGFVELYNPEVAEVKSFNDYIFSDSITEAIADTLKKLIADPIDYVVFIAMCHFHPNATLTKEEITFAGIGTGVFSRLCTPQFQELDCGSISLPEPTESFMDYSPYAKCHIFIPYVGFKELNIEEIMGSTIHLKYNIDLLTGSFVAYVEVYRPTRSQFPRDASPAFDTIINQYEGNCYEMLPLSSTDFRSTISGLLGVVGGVASLAMGNIGGLGAMASGVMGMKSNVNRSGNATGSYGFIGRQRAFILLSRPFQSLPSKFGGYEGFPSNIYMRIGDCSGSAEHGYADGYLETDENTVWGTDITYEYDNVVITAFDDEIEEIKQLFNTGVIVNV